MDKAEKIWYNGQLVDWDSAKVHVLTHALHYGTAVFEGLRCYNADRGPAVFRLYDHVWRLINSAKIYLMNLKYEADEIAEAITTTIKANNLQECYIRPIAFYGYGEMGVNPLKNKVDFSIATWRWGAYLGEDALTKGQVHGLVVAENKPSNSPTPGQMFCQLRKRKFSEDGGAKGRI